MSDIHEGWTIREGLFSNLWHFEHDEFEAELQGEDWYGNGLAGTGSSKEDCIEQIIELEMSGEYTHIFRISPCCGADLYEETDICTSCKEHF
jgi:hypothetical protein